MCVCVCVCVCVCIHIQRAQQVHVVNNVSIKRSFSIMCDILCVLYIRSVRRCVTFSACTVNVINNRTH